MMTSVVLIPWAETDWQSAGRLAAATPLALNDRGQEQAQRWARELAACELAAIYRSDEKTAVQTATVLAEGTEVRAKPAPELKEVGLGLWEGLTETQIQQRFPKVAKLWEDRPASVCPPDGEDLAVASERVKKAIRKIASKHKSGAVGVVLGPLAFKLARCQLEGASLDEMRELTSSEPVWYELVGKVPPALA